MGNFSSDANEVSRSWDWDMKMATDTKMDPPQRYEVLRPAVHTGRGARWTLSVHRQLISLLVLISTRNFLQIAKILQILFGGRVFLPAVDVGGIRPHSTTHDNNTQAHQALPVTRSLLKHATGTQYTQRFQNLCYQCYPATLHCGIDPVISGSILATYSSGTRFI